MKIEIKRKQKGPKSGAKEKTRSEKTSSMPPFLTKTAAKDYFCR